MLPSLGIIQNAPLSYGLPVSEGVDVGRLAQLFRHRTQSYKFLFFRSILESVRNGCDNRLEYVDLLASMIVGAWWPLVFYRLNIGNAAGNDTLTSFLRDIGDVDRARLTESEAKAFALAHVETEKIRGSLRYAPSLLLTPWYGSDITPIYSLGKDGIELHRDWRRYFEANLPVVQGWVDHAWCSWVQDRNPNVSVTMGKLLPLVDRRPLTRERKFFQRAIDRSSLRCAYTDASLAMPLHLDHFLPRSFVGHDRIWNLVPTSLAVNSSKGARIPSVDQVARLANFHARLLTDAFDQDEDKGLIEQYCLDLRIHPKNARKPETVIIAYESMFPAMMAIATRMGFPSDWKPVGESRDLS